MPPPLKRREANLKPPLPRRRSTAASSSRGPNLPGVTAKATSRHQTSVLKPPDLLMELRTPKDTYRPGATSHFSLLGVDLQGLKESEKKRARSPSSSTVTSADQPKKKRCRSGARVDAVFLKPDISLLEKNAIGPQTAKHYAQEINEFVAFAQPRRPWTS